MLVGMYTFSHDEYDHGIITRHDIQPKDYKVLDIEDVNYDDNNNCVIVKTPQDNNHMIPLIKDEYRYFKMKLAEMKESEFDTEFLCLVNNPNEDNIETLHYQHELMTQCFVLNNRYIQNSL